MSRRPQFIRFRAQVSCYLCVLLLASVATLRAAAPSLEVREIPLGKAEPGTIPESFVVSANFQHHAYVAVQQDQQAVFIDGALVGRYQGVGQGTPIFSTEGDSVAFVAIQSQGSVLVLDGKPSPPYEGIDRLRFSHDGRRHAFVAEKGQFVRAVIDGMEGPDYSQIGEGDPIFSHDSSRAAYAARRKSKWVLVENGKEGPEFDALGRGESYFSADGKTCVYLGLRNARYTVIVNGVSSKEYDAISDVVISTNGVVCFRAVRGAHQMVVFGGREGAKQEAVLAGSLSISKDGRHYAFGIKEGRDVRMIVDAADGIPFQEVGPVVFDSSGQRSAYKAIRDLDAFVVVDGKPNPAFATLALDAPVFSPDGSRLAYIAQRSARWHVVLNGQLGPACDDVGQGTLSFSADGKHLAYWAKRGIRSVFILDGAESGEYKTYLGRRRPWSNPDGSFATMALKGDQFVRLETRPPK